MNDESLAGMNVDFLVDAPLQCGHHAAHSYQGFYSAPPPLQLINVRSRELDYYITSHKFARFKMSVELINCKSTQAKLDKFQAVPIK